MSLRGTAWEPSGSERVPLTSAPAHRWGLYVTRDGCEVLLATASERAPLERMRIAIGRGETRELAGVR